MSFQFPANPKDGDVVIRLVDGTQIKGTYKESTNTWEVGELPEEPGVPGPQGPRGDQGPKGDPGQGITISGIVDKIEDLPLPNDYIFQFWLVDETNTLYYSDGAVWRDLGSPVQGPPGNDGADGTNGSNGLNGTPGKGWYDTQIIDERPSNYQISFLSNDGLDFVTDNIMGAQGEPGELEVASATNLGGIKIGRGLAILPDGTLNAGVTSVDLETTPVSEAGLAVTYAPIFFDFGEFKQESALLERNDYVWMNDSKTATMPSGADGAFMFYFSSTSCRPFVENPENPAEGWRAFRAYIKNTITLTNAVYAAGRTNIMSHVHNHNLSIPKGPGTIANRKSTLPLTKINELEFEPGATIQFDFQQELWRAGGTTVTGGTSRVVIFPFRRSDATDTGAYAARDLTPQPVVVNEDGFVFYSDTTAQNVIDELFPPITPEEAKQDAGETLREVIIENMSWIDSNLAYVNETERAQLIDYRDQLYDARNLPGTAEDVANYIAPITEGINAILTYTFRFEV